jgi:hypothetical protein
MMIWSASLTAWRIAAVPVLRPLPDEEIRDRYDRVGSCSAFFDLSFIGAFPGVR